MRAGEGHGTCGLLVTNGASAGAEQPVAGVAKSRKNVAAFIQLAIQRGAQNRNVRMSFMNARDAQR